MIFDAVVLAGGRSSRLGGHPKSALIFEGETLLQHTLNAVQDARQIVVVGEPGATAVSPATVVVREDPPFGGPVAAIAAGLAAATGDTSEWVVLLACDMPFVAQAVPVLLANADHDGALAVDADGREQYLLACYRRAALDDALNLQDGAVTGMSVRQLIAGLTTTLVTVPAGSSTDIDTWDDAARLGISPETGARHG
ncbi:NTP transferase domain-containing protein [Salinibacterium sp. G-O1]|uniref:molybdenum cofactor guanylyltransferase n=1 Tax=Salinibacterium sp. G-O1 TaxID=3046208 RepID=UPI0024BAF53A|nr:NTP transferase domain-containing protein [Salinibacterium sp. G-O1]MDJ0335173.1 NTP transferase domain-containing protein [Salinibacterium sp. G-O1]